MKRIPRNPEKFEPLELYTTLGRIHGYKLQDPEHAKAFVTRVENSLEVSQKNQILIHGKRMEALFGLLAAGLGNCRLVKTEDTGDIITDEEDILPPDYQLILKDGSKMFVEVKNCNSKDFSEVYTLNKDYVKRIEKFGELHGIPVYYAIYYRIINRWTLQPLSSLFESADRYTTNIIDSLARCEMAKLGDMLIGTKSPLTLELIADQTRNPHIDDDSQASFIIENVKMYCDNVEIVSYAEKTIAFYLIRYGDWDSGNPEGILDDDGRLHSVTYTITPESSENTERNGFDFIGMLSSMITKKFNEETVQDKKIIAIDTSLEPSDFSVKIPSDYKGGELSLWRLIIQPNTDFKKSTDELNFNHTMQKEKSQ